jgi:hypothetical protein
MAALTRWKSVRFEITIIGLPADKKGGLTEFYNCDQIENAVKGSKATNRHSATSMLKAGMFFVASIKKQREFP